MKKSKYAKIEDIRIMQSNQEVWDDWLKMDNEYATNTIIGLRYVGKN